MFGINQTKEYANGKIIVTDFRKLKARDLSPHYNDDDLKDSGILFSIDGKVYINRNDMWCETFRTTFELMISLTRYNLESVRKVYKQKYPHIRNQKDLVKMDLKEEESFKEAFFLVMIPFELERREVERKYYAKPRR